MSKYHIQNMLSGPNETEVAILHKEFILSQKARKADDQIFTIWKSNTMGGIA